MLGMERDGGEGWGSNTTTIYIVVDDDMVNSYTIILVIENGVLGC